MRKKHGLFSGNNREKNKRIYSIWSNMKKRCYRKANKDYQYYGGKGIRVCDEWLSFFNFYNWAVHNGYSDHLFLDRIDTGKNYSPENCRWATQEEQANNKTNNIMVRIGNTNFTVAQLAARYDIPESTLRYRVKNNWPSDRLLKKAGGWR